LIYFYRFSQNLVAYQRTAVASSTTINAPTNPIEQANITNAAAPPPPAPAPQAAGGNNNNNDNEQENDLLGILNMLIELFVLCSIIYFYSTFSRFLVVFVLFALLYL
jgi:flagellar biosynthesis protein FliP